MPRLLTNLAITATLLVLGLLPGELYLSAVAAPTEKAAYRVLYDGPPISRLVYGSSQAQCTVDPRLLPGRAPFWNYGAFGAGPRYVQAAYAGWRRHRPAPTHVLLEAGWFQFKPGVLWRIYDHESQFMDARDLWGAATRPDADWGVLLWNRFALPKYRELALIGAVDRAGAGIWESQRGFVVMRNEEPGVVRPSGVLSQPDDPAAIAAFEAVLDAFARDGVSVVVASMPTYAPYSPPHAAETATLRRILEAHRVPWLDYDGARGDGIREDVGNFWNWTHVNATGAAAVTRRLARDLVAMGWLEADDAVQ